MTKLSHRILYFALRKLNAIDNNIKRNKQLEIDASWLAKFNSDNNFDYLLRNNINIRLYKDSVLSRLIFDGFENDELNFVQRFLKPNDIFFDIGANVGMFSLIASNQVGIGGRVIAFEPSPKTFARLKENISINKMDNIKAINIGLSNAESYLSLNISENGYDAWNSFADTEDGKFHNKVEVKVCKLDDILMEENIAEVNLIKLDVEGWEKYVLQGGRKFFTTKSPVVMVEFTEANTFAAGYFVQELYDIMEGWGYKWYRYINYELVLESKKLHYPYDNLFAIKDLEDAKKRIKSDASTFS